MKLRTFIGVALDAGSNWAIDFPGYEGFTLTVVQKGECWLAVGVEEQIHLRSGDCFLLTDGKPFALASDLCPRQRYSAEQLYMHARQGVAVCNGGGHFFAVGIIFRFQGHLPPLLLGRLPPVIQIEGGSDHAAALRFSLDRFNAEMRNVGLGRSLILSHLAPIMLMEIIRAYVSSSPIEKNWLQALAHPGLSKVLDAIQTDYKRNWSLDELAVLAQMSRSGFALVFKEIVGVTPLVYLANWRMQIACERLRSSDDSISAIALQVGYASESAFSTAFTRVLKCRPGAYRSTTSQRKVG